MRRLWLAAALAACGDGSAVAPNDGETGGACPERVYAYGMVTAESTVLDGVCGKYAGYTFDQWLSLDRGGAPLCLVTCMTTGVDKAPVGTRTGCEALAVTDSWTDPGRLQFGGGPVLCFPPDGGDCATVCQ